MIDSFGGLHFGLSLILRFNKYFEFFVYIRWYQS